MHFRKAGIPFPRDPLQKDLEKLEKAIVEKEVNSIVFLGDLFHSRHNTEWELFCDFSLSELSHYNLVLVSGNHDMLSFWDYDRANLLVYKNTFEISPFVFSHYPIEHNNLYPITGHIHPGVRLLGNGRQSLSLRCFYFGKTYAVMPAFGSLTGLKVLRPKSQDDVFVTTGKTILKV